MRKEQYRWYRHGNGYWKSIPKSLRLLQLLRPYDADLLQLAVELVREVLVVRGNPFPIAAPASSRNLRQHPLPCRYHLYCSFLKSDLLFRLEEIGLLDRLDVAAAPEAIILFGSASRGEDVAGSDIDLFLLASEIAPDLRKEEAALKRTVSLHFAERFSKLPSELRNSILNGIRLRGYVKVF